MLQAGAVGRDQLSQKITRQREEAITAAVAKVTFDITNAVKNGALEPWVRGKLLGLQADLERMVNAGQLDRVNLEKLGNLLAAVADHKIEPGEEQYLDSNYILRKKPKNTEMAIGKKKLEALRLQSARIADVLRPIKGLSACAEFFDGVQEDIKMALEEGVTTKNALTQSWVFSQNIVGIKILLLARFNLMVSYCS